MNARQETKHDYDAFHKSENNLTYDVHGQVGRSYANGRFKVLAEISEGCEPILSVKLFSRTRIPSDKAVGDKCYENKGEGDGKNYKYVSILSQTYYIKT